MADNLPLGLQDFRGVIEGGYKYIDKTMYLHRMATAGKYYFLSRPRRFGKSLTVSTLNELYKGSRELFKGLWIEDKWDWSRKHPVIHLSFKDINFEQRGLEEPLSERITEIGSNHQVQLVAKSARDRMRELIIALSGPRKVVVLIDEYDAPIVHYLGVNVDKSIENREYLKEFYNVLKEMDGHLEFVFLTGVSKFSKTGIFSGLNNLTDLTMDASFATMLGYTQEELTSCFSEKIDEAAESLEMSRDELLEGMRVWYNGYRFHHRAERVYNPLSVNMFLYRKEFDNFWFATGTPTFLVNILKREGIYQLHLNNISALDFDSFDLDDIRSYGLLYQTGYLTIQSRDEYGLYSLDYPNREVKDSMLTYLMEAFGGVSKSEGVGTATEMAKAFMTDDIDGVMRALQSIFSRIPYQLYDKHPEKFYHAAIHLLFTYMGLRVRSEVCTSDGRVDSMVETPTRFYILEFKLDRSAGEALEQIMQKKYYRSAWESSKPVTCVGVNFSSETRNIEGYRVQGMG
jgi:hypothetical protein